MSSPTDLVNLDLTNLDTSINRFMEKIQECDFIFLIGTPALKERLQEDGSNNLKTEFGHIQRRLSSKPDCLLPLIFQGDGDFDQAFNQTMPVEFIEQHNILVKDCRRQGDEWVSADSLKRYIDALTFHEDEEGSANSGIIPIIYKRSSWDQNTKQQCSAFRRALLYSLKEEYTPLKINSRTVFYVVAFLSMFVAAEVRYSLLYRFLIFLSKLKLVKPTGQLRPLPCPFWIPTPSRDSIRKLSEVRNLFRACHIYATTGDNSERFGAAIPNFHSDSEDGQIAFGVFLIKKEAVIHHNISKAELGCAPLTVLHLFQAVNKYAENHGKRLVDANNFNADTPAFYRQELGAAFPTFHQVEEATYGACFLKPEAVKWHQTPKSELTNLGNFNEEDDDCNRFRIFCDYAKKHSSKGFAVAFPSFYYSGDGNKRRFGTILVKENACEFKKVTAYELIKCLEKFKDKPKRSCALLAKL